MCTNPNVPVESIIAQQEQLKSFTILSRGELVLLMKIDVDGKNHGKLICALMFDYRRPNERLWPHDIVAPEPPMILRNMGLKQQMIPYRQSARGEDLEPRRKLRNGKHPGFLDHIRGLCTAINGLNWQ